MIQKEIIKKRLLSILFSSLLVNCFVQVNLVKAETPSYENQEGGIREILRKSDKLHKEFSNLSYYVNLAQRKKISSEVNIKNDISWLIQFKNLKSSANEKSLIDQWTTLRQQICKEENPKCLSENESINEPVGNVDTIVTNIDEVNKNLTDILSDTSISTDDLLNQVSIELQKVNNNEDDSVKNQFYELNSKLFQLNSALVPKESVPVKTEDPQDSINNKFSNNIKEFNNTILPLLFLALGGFLTWRIWNALKSPKDSELQAIQDLDSSKLKPLQDLDSSKLQAIQDLDSSKLKPLQDLDPSKLKALQDLDLSKLKALQDLDLSKLKEPQSDQPNNRKTNKTVKKINSDKGGSSIVIDSEQLEELIANYNEKIINKNQIIKVAANLKSIEKRRTGDNVPLILTREDKDNETSWVLTQYPLKDNCRFLIPRLGLIINDRNYQTIEDIFTCHGYKNRASNNFTLKLPAKVKFRSNNEWELVEPGELLFEENKMLEK